MSANRFATFVNANLQGKNVLRAYVHPKTKCVRLVFSDHTCCEIGAEIGGSAPNLFPYPTITSAENEA